jgi:lysozyme family protein
MFGITEQVARAYGYDGPMQSLSRDIAMDIYKRRFWVAPHFDQIEPLSEAIAMELFDTGVNMGPTVAAKFLQRCLNVLNREGKDYPDIGADGQIGPMTIQALKGYLAKRPGPVGETRMLRALNALQGARYVELAEGRPANEEFEFGWLDRVAI